MTRHRPLVYRPARDATVPLPITQTLDHPKRASAHEDVPAKWPRATRLRGHLWLTLLVGMLAMGALVALLNAASSWVQARDLDWTYGYPRLYQADAVVGHHHDSSEHPSHFLAVKWD